MMPRSDARRAHLAQGRLIRTPTFICRWPLTCHFTHWTALAQAPTGRSAAFYHACAVDATSFRPCTDGHMPKSSIELNVLYVEPFGSSKKLLRMIDTVATADVDGSYPSIPLWRKINGYAPTHTTMQGVRNISMAILARELVEVTETRESQEEPWQFEAEYNLPIFFIPEATLNPSNAADPPLLSGNDSGERSRLESARLACERFRGVDIVVFPAAGRDPYGMNSQVMREARACGADIAVPISNHRLLLEQCQPVQDHLLLAGILTKIMARDLDSLQPNASMNAPAAPLASDLLRWSTRQCDPSPARPEGYFCNDIFSLCRYTAVSCCDFEGNLMLHTLLAPGSGVEYATFPFYACSQTNHMSFSIIETPFNHIACTSRFRKAFVFGAFDDNNFAHFIHVRPHRFGRTYSRRTRAAYALLLAGFILGALVDSLAGRRANYGDYGHSGHHRSCGGALSFSTA